MEISKHIVAFGGDAMIAEPENKLSAQFVLSLARKPQSESKQRVCFLPTASGEPDT